MAIRAYSENWLEPAMTALGDAFDYAVNDCGIGADDFLAYFTASPLCPAFERGEPRVVAGMSGVEIAREAVGAALGCEPDAPSREAFSRSPEFWCGWVLAYCQWRTGRRFGELRDAFPCREIIALYPALHEAGPDAFVDRAAERLRAAFPGTRLARLRTAARLSQQALAEKAGVGLRSIQMYEQRRKDINRAEAATLRALSLALGCGMEDLMEPCDDSP